MNLLKLKYKGFLEQKYWLDAIIDRPATVKWYFHWRSSLYGKHSPLEDELPWITYSAIDWLAGYLKEDMILFEWGSGGSTIFFAQRVKQVITIEHDPIWYQEVAQALDPKAYKNVLLKLVEPEPSGNINEWYASTDMSFVGFSFEQYIKAIDSYPNEIFDMVVVDGRARPGCMKQALPKIKPGGYLVLDNSDRNEYKNGQDLVFGWRSISFFGPGPYADFPTGTTIWQCPHKD